VNNSTAAVVENTSRNFCIPTCYFYVHTFLERNVCEILCIMLGTTLSVVFANHRLKKT